MKAEELNAIIERHQKWLEDAPGGMQADPRGGNLQEANLDYSAWPLWCRSLKAKADYRLVLQLLFRAMTLAQGSEISGELKNALDTDALIEQANRFHRVEECGRLNRWKSEGGAKDEIHSGGAGGDAPGGRGD